MLKAIYSGSFNPIHYGHLNISRYVLEEGGADRLELILSPKNPLKEDSQLHEAEERLSALHGAIETLPNLKERITISDIEFHLPTPLYTINTLRYIRSQERDSELVFVMGGDNICILESWHNWQSLIKEFEIWVYPRPGYPNAENMCNYYNKMPDTLGIRYMADAPLFDISSTEIRERDSHILY